MELTFFSSVGWESWDVEARPAIPERMPVLVDDDLLFDDDGGAEAERGGEPVAAGAAVQRCALGRNVGGLRAGAAGLDGVLRGHGTGVFAGREDLKAVLGAYAVHRADGPEQARFAATTWNRHVSVLSCFYQWAVAEGHAGAVPFSYAQAQVRYGDVTAGRAGEPGPAAGPEAARDDQVPGG